MSLVRYLTSSIFCVAVLLFFGLAYPQHLHYQEQYQLFLFDSSYVWDIVKQPGGVADLLGRFCTQFFLCLGWSCNHRCPAIDSATYGSPINGLQQVVWPEFYSICPAVAISAR